MMKRCVSCGMTSCTSCGRRAYPRPRGPEFTPFYWLLAASPLMVLTLIPLRAWIFLGGIAVVTGIILGVMKFRLARESREIMRQVC